MPQPTYRLSNRQLKEYLVRNQVISIAIPLLDTWPDKLWDHPNNSVDIVEWVATALALSTEHIRTAQLTEVPVNPMRKPIGGLGEILGEILRPELVGQFFHQLVTVLVVEVGTPRAPRNQRTDLPQWPASVRYGEWAWPTTD